MTAGAVLGYPSNVLTWPNCAPVIQAAPIFGDWNRHVLADSRTHLWLEDARTCSNSAPNVTM